MHYSKKIGFNRLTMRVKAMSGWTVHRAVLRGKTMLPGPGRLISVLLFVAFFVSPALAGVDNAGKGAFFTEHVERIVSVPGMGVIVADSVKPCPVTGTVTYVYEDENGFRICINNTCGPYVEAVAKGMPIVSPDRNHWAAVVKKGGKLHVMLDGNLSPGYDRVAALQFSPDSMKVAYIAQMGDAFFVCMNQERHPSFSLVDPEQGLVFSRDSKQLAYAVRKDKNVWHLVINGKPGSAAWEEISLVTFSPDGSRLVYAAKQNEQWHLVEGDNISPGYRDILRVTFSSDSRSLVYIARSKEGAFAVLNGRKQDAFEAVLGEPTFSFNGERLAYSVLEKPRLGNQYMRLVVDGKPGAPYEYISAYLFSSDGKQYAYVAGDEKKKFVVHGDVEQDPYDLLGIPTFDPTARRLAYQAQKGDKWLVVDNRKKGPAFDMVTRPVFSLNGARMAYLATEDSLFVVMADDKILGKYKWAGELSFSPDSRHLAYAAARDTEAGKFESFLVINGHEGKERFLGLVTDSSMVFIDHQTVAGIVVRDNPREFWLMRVTISEGQ